MQLDPAIAKLLSIDPKQASIARAGSGCSSATAYRIKHGRDDGTVTSYFLKIGSGSDAEHMFAGEHASLNALAAAVPGLAPRSFGHGEMSDKAGQSFLVTEFLDMAGHNKSSSGSLAAKLGKLHTTSAPIPHGYDSQQFGFPVPTCCGDTRQENDFCGSWAQFYADHRLRFIVRQSKKRNGNDKELEQTIEQLCQEVVPRLIGDDHLNGGRGIQSVVVHGDLWSGNASSGLLPGMAAAEDVVFDSSACYAHSEYDLGIMKMFGGFDSDMMTAYHKICPKTEPVDEYDDRVKLYMLYHQLNHHAMFGGGYRGGAMSNARALLGKYKHASM